MATDLLRPGLRLLFCGYNPSLLSGTTGRHYAHPGNRFWRVLHAAGITERLRKPEEDEALLDEGIGFTNLCPRPTRRADELSREEIRTGAEALETKLERYRPATVAYTGIGVYKWFRATSKAGWGVQPEPAVPGVADVVVPSPSGLNRMRFEELVEHYRVLKRFVEGSRP
ncbi:G/U mismatch-specific DNA glycosylase [Rubrobacter tropicus]|uniref:G/U mismatch-specific DNA glycosylase n=1 Tax=Rubrobacter tropicus TaxID=2653851 RepID=A0A6G8Q5E3_9ACTN|nr:G/U mismatch-specific DNA glycosylase [Rubrobacter tropicus]QIN81686.1 G/U mismatch-specific DNA glycosylase [Rubrobacter tropicus]